MMSFAVICVFFSILVISQSLPTTDYVVNTTISTTSANATASTTLLPQYPTTLFNISANNYTFGNYTMPHTTTWGTEQTLTLFGVFGGVLLVIIFSCYIYKKTSTPGYPTEPCCGINC